MSETPDLPTGAQGPGYYGDRPSRLQWRTRTIDPVSAPRRAGQQSPHPTWYVGDRILIPESPFDREGNRSLEWLERAAERLGLDVEVQQESLDDAELVREADLDPQTTDDLLRVFGYSVRLRYREGEQGALPDAWRLVELTLTSRCALAIVQAQDLLALGNEARMNRPGTTQGNWSWRLEPGQLTAADAKRLRAAAAATGRVGR